jgi:hypothetical protein
MFNGLRCARRASEVRSSGGSWAAHVLGFGNSGKPPIHVEEFIFNEMAQAFEMGGFYRFSSALKNAASVLDLLIGSP